MNDTRGQYEVMLIENPYSFVNNTTDSLLAYDYAVTSVWPVLLNWYYEDGSVNMSFSDFRCLRANEIRSGSRQPETLGVREPDNLENWSCQVTLPGLWHLLFTTGILTVLLLM